MSQATRAHSVTVQGWVRTKHHGGKNETFVQEYDGKSATSPGRHVHDIHLDHASRMCTIVRVDTGDRTVVPFEQCLSWNPYSDEEMKAAEDAELEKATAPKTGGKGGKAA